MTKNTHLDDELTKIAKITGVYKAPPRKTHDPYREGYERGKQEMVKIIILFAAIGILIAVIAVWWITADMRMAAIISNAPSPAEMHHYLEGK
ncbi:hypothetical protein GP475_08910 [Corynebacterium poyangense]|uniref:Uncharacterized protein n=1 Tax=Corynebacterium poyangense TaxID=2684405 RepID=A0A7H0SQC1_9CORY|nr:hypothetical protein [Corynebacterium poyangense]QNQ90746.1 hypothetical protein GP475_08910 [Corynebacterium poyangense]